MVAPPINQYKTMSKVNFSIIYLVRTVCELTSSIIQKHYTQTTSFCLHLQKSFSTEHSKTTSKYNTPCVLLSLTHPFLNGCCLVRVCFLGFVHSSSSLSVSCSHLSQTALNSNPPYRKMASTKFLCKVDVQWFNKLFGPIRTGHILQPQKWLEIYKCQQTITPINPLRSASLATNSHSFTSRFPYFLETLCLYFEKSYCRPNSILIRSNTDG